MAAKKPIINCHTHIFTGNHVPPYLAKTFLPWPLYYLVPISLVVKIFRFWYNYPYTWQFKPWYRNIQDRWYQFTMFIKRIGLLRLLSFIIGAILTIQVFFIFFDWISTVSAPTNKIAIAIEHLRRWLLDNWLLLIPRFLTGKLIFILLLILFFKPGRNLVWFALKKVWSVLGVLPGKQSRELAKRYLNIGRFAFYTQQTRVYSRLKNQYPDPTGFVVLPMDMEYMEAGKLKAHSRYVQQMLALWAIKNNPANTNHIFPFVFAEPRRIAAEGILQFDYKIANGKIVLNNCFIQDYIENKKFSGFKIYPALGYYPFDENLLILWKYAADNGLPIITHCIRGTIYYRGPKKKEWDRHPIFEQVKQFNTYEPLLLPEIKNRDFINNFTHPLNYLCLLEEKLLRKVVAAAINPQIKVVFGYTDDATPLQNNLQHLKISFAHFGGDDEWSRFIELDRDNYGSQLSKNPAHGINFLTDNKGLPSPGKPEQIWKYADWYSIICSLMLQYPNVYADVSYILHCPEIQPLLKQTLMNPGLNDRILFGTDFYVVRNHKSEKSMLADMQYYLSAGDFDQIARDNPRRFLSNLLHGPVKI